MRLTLGSVQFSATLIPTLALLLLMPLLLWLGFWQLDRANAKADMINAYQQRLSDPPLQLRELNSITDNHRYRQLQLDGHYDAQQQIILDNQLYRGRVGYSIYTPLQPSSGDPAVLINRGWLPIGPSRQQLPDLSVTEGSVSISGLVDQPANPGIYLAMTVDSEWPLLVQHIDYPAIATRLGYPLLPIIVKLDPAAEHGYLRDWQIEFGTMTPQRHRGYAVQWFALATTLFILYLVLNFRWNR